MKRTFTFLLALIICQFVHSQSINLPPLLQPSYDTSLRLYSDLFHLDTVFTHPNILAKISENLSIVNDTDHLGNLNAGLFNFVNDSADSMVLSGTGLLKANSNYFLYDSSFSISIWFKYIRPANNRAGEHMIMSKFYYPNAVDTMLPLSISLVDHDQSFDIKLNSYRYGIISTTSALLYSNPEWCNLVVTQDKSNNTISFYFNGQLVLNKTLAVVNSEIPTGKPKLLLGRNIFIGSQYTRYYNSNVIATGYLQQFTGYISDLAIWSRALTDNEAISIYNPSTLPIAPSLIYKNSTFKVNTSLYSKISIEYSDNGKNFYLLDDMKEISSGEYSLLSLNSHTYYRAKFVNNIGEITYSNILRFNISSHKSFINNGLIHLNTEDKISNIQIFDELGRTLAVYTPSNSVIDISRFKGVTIARFLGNNQFSIKSVQ